jgi:hypothetical protein
MYGDRRDEWIARAFGITPSAVANSVPPQHRDAAHRLRLLRMRHRWPVIGDDANPSPTARRRRRSLTHDPDTTRRARGALRFSTRVPDALRHSSCRCAEPGPISPAPSLRQHVPRADKRSCRSRGTPQGLSGAAASVNVPFLDAHAQFTASTAVKLFAPALGH